MGNKLVLIVVAVVVVIGAVIGLGVTGVVPIPGLTHAKKKAKKADAKPDAAATDAKKADPPKVAANVPAPPPKPPAAPKPTLDLDKGYAKLAAVWGEIPPDKIQEILEAEYKPDTAAPILKRMDEDKVAAVIGGMKPKDAAAYSQALAKEASKVPPPPSE